MPESNERGGKNDEERLNKYKESLKLEAESLVLHVFPQKVLEVHDLVNSDKFRPLRIDEIHCETQIPFPEKLISKSEEVNHLLGTSPKRAKLDPYPDGTIEGTKIMGFVTGTVHSNAKLIELIDVVKPVVREAVENVNKLKMWISFLIPRIEDGNNFGVSIQEDTLGEVRTVEAEAASFLDQISRYLLTRGRIVTKVAKYPHVEDYRRAIQDLDEKEFLNLRLVLMEIRNHYSTLHDIIVKNLEKIKKPRTSNMEHLY